VGEPREGAANPRRAPLWGEELVLRVRRSSSHTLAKESDERWDDEASVSTTLSRHCGCSGFVPLFLPILCPARSYILLERKRGGIARVLALDKEFSFPGRIHGLTLSHPSHSYILTYDLRTISPNGGCLGRCARPLERIRVFEDSRAGAMWVRRADARRIPDEPPCGARSLGSLLAAVQIVNLLMARRRPEARRGYEIAWDS
jgi:hypothetical protein